MFDLKTVPRVVVKKISYKDIDIIQDAHRPKTYRLLNRGNQWMMFDNFMIQCCQFYLKHGLVSHEFTNLDVRKFIKETCFEFYDWSSDQNLPLNIRLYKDELHDIFINEYTDYSKLSKKRFTQWLSIFGQFHSHKIIEGKTNNRRWIIFENENTPPPPTVDVWDELNNKAGF